MDDEIVITRNPKPQYANSNGFTLAFHDGPIASGRDLIDALDRHRVAIQAIETRGRAIPSFEEMQQFAERIETSATMKERIEEFQDEHLEDLKALYSYHAADYTEDANHFYFSVVDSMEEDTKDRQITAVCRSLEDLYTQEQHCTFLNPPWLREYNEMRHAYLTQLLELQNHFQELEKSEKATRRAEFAQFPKSKAEFYSSNGESQARVAKFLLADKAAQEQMLDDYGWAWRATQGLIDESKKDNMFAASLRAIILTQASKTADPRKARPNISIIT